MEFESLSITIDGEAADDLYADLLGVEVELDDDMAAMFRLRLAMAQALDGTWDYLDDARLQVWKPVVIAAGLGAEPEALIDGYITHVRPSFDPDPSRCALEIWGMDASVLLDREEQLKDWPDKKDSDIAGEIFEAYGLAPDLAPTTVTHDQAISTIIQRETDMQFLRRLALRNGFVCYVAGRAGYFGPPRLDAPPQPVLAVHFGDETNVGRFSLEVNGLVPANVAMAQLDRVTKEPLEVLVDTGLQPALGATDGAGLLSADIRPALVHLAETVATGSPEMHALAQGLFHEAAWFVTGAGTVDGNAYGHVLRARGTVIIKGVGERYSGIYYVAHVTHTFTPEGYTQTFVVKRNGLLPTGAEDFSAPGE